MTQEELNQFRDLLNEEKNRVEKSINNTAKEIQSATLEQGGDEADEANALSNASLSIRLKEREVQLLHKVKAALKRVEDGSYGECLSCGDDIGVKRLMIRPVTTMCIKCKELQEKREGGYNHANRTEEMA